MKACPVCSREYSREHTHCSDDGVTLVALQSGRNERPEALIGQVIDGRYRVERILGRGGMGTVYACRHVVVGKALAIKVLRSDTEDPAGVLQRFVREAQAANLVKSRHIVEMLDFGQLPQGSVYAVMELLEGQDLTHALRDKKLTHEDMRRVFAQIADALHLAHVSGIVHRDLKPDNVFLVHEGDDPHFVKLLDFGIAKLMYEDASNLTQTGVILGTPYYMSPEQARGEPVDFRTDVYSLGVMMYRAFTGKLPFVADSTMGVLTRHLTELPEPPSRISAVEPWIEQVILRCLEKKREHRFQSMQAIATALRTGVVRTQAPQVGEDPTVEDERQRAASGSFRAASQSTSGLRHRDAATVPDPQLAAFSPQEAASQGLSGPRFRDAATVPDPSHISQAMHPAGASATGPRPAETGASRAVVTSNTGAFQAPSAPKRSTLAVVFGAVTMAVLGAGIAVFVVGLGSHAPPPPASATVAAEAPPPVVEAPAPAPEPEPEPTVAASASAAPIAPPPPPAAAAPAAPPAAPLPPPAAAPAAPAPAATLPPEPTPAPPPTAAGKRPEIRSPFD